MWKETKLVMNMSILIIKDVIICLEFQAGIPATPDTVSYLEGTMRVCFFKYENIHYFIKEIKSCGCVQLKIPRLLAEGLKRGNPSFPHLKPVPVGTHILSPGSQPLNQNTPVPAAQQAGGCRANTVICSYVDTHRSRPWSSTVFHNW